MTATAGVELAHTTPRLQVNGADVAPAWSNALRQIRIERGVRTIGRTVLVFADPEHELAKSSSYGLGAEAAVLTSDGKTYFKGVVAGRGLSAVDGDVTLSITVHDKATRLVGSSLASTSTTSKIGDVLQQLVSAVGMTLSGPGGKATGLTMPWLGLTGNALAVVDEIAGRYGYDWEVDGTALRMWDATSGAPSGATGTSLAVGRDLGEFSVEVTDAHARNLEVRTWNDKELKFDSSRAQPGASRGQSSWLPALKTSALPTHLHSAGDSVMAAEGGVLAAAQAGSGRRVRARGKALLNPGVAPGNSIDVTNSGPTDGTYYVREVEHVWGPHGSWTRFVAGDRDAPRLASPSQPLPPVSTFAHPHLTIGVVTEIGDGSNDSASTSTTKQPIAVKVKFPLLDEQFGSTWARLVVPGAGKERGLLATPAVNDEVLVAFVDGDTRRPVVIGGLYGGKHTPRATGMLDARAATTHLSSHSQHVVELSDGQEPAKQHVALRLGNGEQFIRLGKDKVQIDVPANVPLRLGNTQAYIEIDGGKVTISGQDIVINAKNSVKVDSSTVGIAAKTTATVEGKASLSLKASGTAGLEASGPLSLKGALVRIN